MTRQKIHWKVAVGMAWMLVLAGCAGKAIDYPEGHPCAGPSQPRPTWVLDGEALDGKYVGVGQAGPMDGNFFLQKMRARQMALVNLLDQVQVTVESSMELMESQVQKADGDLSATRLAIRRLRVASSLTFSDVTPAGSYIDPATCTLWVRYTIRRNIADNLVALKQAKALHQMTFDEKEATPAQKLRWITDALARLRDVDFTVLPKDAGNENHLTELFVKRKGELEKSGTQTTVWILSAPPCLRASLAPRLATLAETHGATFLGVPCSAAHACIGQAREYAGKILVWIKAGSEKTSGSLGIHKGTLRLGVARFDVSSGALLSTQMKEGQTFAFDEGDFDWGGLAEQLLAKETIKKALK